MPSDRRERLLAAIKSRDVETTQRILEASASYIARKYSGPIADVGDLLPSLLLRASGITIVDADNLLWVMEIIDVCGIYQAFNEAREAKHDG
jgi:hypothetical protein